MAFVTAALEGLLVKTLQAVAVQVGVGAIFLGARWGYRRIKEFCG